ncbi:sporadically distributed protein, TIGR04141 family [Nannocystis exedens]|uniref:Sporadically distributed protein, TIGR04141 family n=1 Tax=Nannocystis exedens TaxID=54 RepID=A0A1I1UWD7_9BACT|nr:DUF6119 family protein [Nannocystis exedens]PCC72138.1 hypothetical protein NAEX_05217 [Nannocystis exedens]SFD74994.1 sporadically distributed protein, TIGR04141 family [Nannocystis exedens]
MPLTPLTIYRLASKVPLKKLLAEGADVTFCKPLARDISSFSSSEVLFAYGRSEPEPIPWLSLLQQHFADVPTIKAQSTRGVLLLRSSGSTYALPFGAGGGFLIDSTQIFRGWGRRIALNLLYDGSGQLIDNGKALRRGRRSQLGQGLVTDVQASKEVPLDVLGFDSAQEILKSVTVARPPRTGWGRYVEGADAFRLRWGGLLANLPALCAELDRLYALRHYEKHFDFIDDLHKVDDHKTLQDVWAEAARLIKTHKLDGLGLSPPRPVDLVTAQFALLGVTGHGQKGGHPLDEFSVENYKDILKALSALASLDANELRKHRLRFTPEDGDSFEEPVKNLLEGVVALGDATYALHGGDVYAVRNTFIGELDDFVDAIDADAAAALSLPTFKSVPMRQKKQRSGGTIPARDELAYNQTIAAVQKGLCMDGKNVITLPKRTTPVELCDVLLAGRELVHSKHGTGSGTLSHLFAQASNSAELLLDSEDFRAAARKRIRDVARGASTAHGPFEAAIPAKLLNGSEHVITLVIITNSWGAASQAPRPVSEVLPFFSKINLRSAVKRLRQRSFTVRIARVPH